MLIRNRQSANQEFAKKRDLPLLDHVLLPRTGALEAALEVLGPDSRQEGNFERVVDLTIAYPQGKPLDLGEVLLGSRGPCQTQFHYRSWHVKVGK